MTSEQQSRTKAARNSRKGGISAEERESIIREIIHNLRELGLVADSDGEPADEHGNG